MLIISTIYKKIEGFCWNNILNPNARLLKVKLKQVSVNDVGSMSLLSTFHLLSNKYIIGLLNTNLIFDYYREFVNCTVNVQINDIRQIPIIIPDNKQLSSIETLVNEAIIIKTTSINNERYNELLNIEYTIEQEVLQLYQI